MIEHEAPQNSPEWRAARLGLPTASRAASLVTPRSHAPSKGVLAYADRLALELYRGHPSEEFGGSRATAHGHRFEPNARAAYAWLADVDVRLAGFCTDDRGRYGASPDGLVGRDGGLETKCPEDAEYIRVLMHVEEHGVAPPEYLPQLHMLMLVTERLWWDLTFWHPDMPDEPVIVRVRRERAWDARLLRQIAVCRRRRDRVLATLRARAARFGDAPASAALRVTDGAAPDGESMAA